MSFHVHITIKCKLKNNKRKKNYRVGGLGLSVFCQFLLGIFVQKEINHLISCENYFFDAQKVSAKLILSVCQKISF